MSADQQQEFSWQQLQAQLDRIEQRLDQIDARQRRQQELLDELTPIGREVMSVATERFAQWEQRGYFDFGKEGLGLVTEVMDSFGPDDVRLLRENIVTILSLVRHLTRPKMTALATQISQKVAQPVEHGTSLWSMVKSTHDEDTRRGLATALEVLKQLGRGVEQVAEQRQSAQSKLAQRLGATSAAQAPAAKVAPKRHIPEVKLPPTSHTAPVSALQIPGYALNDEGFLLDPQTWDEAFAQQMAQRSGIEQLGPEHWQIINFMRGQYLEHGKTPNIRAVTSATGVATKQLYALFLKAPGVTAARVAGVPKPVGCI